MKINLKELIKEGNLKKFFIEINDAQISTNKFDDIDFNNIILLESRYTKLTTDVNNGLVNREDEMLEFSKISKSALDTISKYDDTPVVEENYDTELDLIFNQIHEIFGKFENRQPKYTWLDDSREGLSKIEKKWGARKFQVSVLALIKSGKSTLLNSWIGREFLPSASVAETMKLIRVRHNSRRKKVGVLKSEDKILVHGVNEIRHFIRDLNDKERNDIETDVKGDLTLEFCLKSLEKKNLNGCGFDLVDTPGFNEHGIDKLDGKVERIVKSSDVIIYLLDFTKLKTAEEVLMLENLKKWKSEILLLMKHRLFFVVNKIDAINRHDREKNFSRKEIKEYVANLIESSIDLKIGNDNIILVSAEKALLCKLVESGDATEEQIIDFKEKAFGQYGAKGKTNKDCMEAIPEMIQHTGFKELEEKVLNIITNNRLQILLSSIADDLLNIINQMSNNIDVSKATLKSDIEDINELRRKIASIKKELGSIKKISQKFKKKLIDKVKDEFTGFEKEVHKIVRNGFSKTDESTPRYPWLQPITDVLGKTEFLFVYKNNASFEAILNTIFRKFKNWHRIRSTLEQVSRTAIH